MTKLHNIIGWSDDQFEEWLRTIDTVTLIELFIEATPDASIGYPMGTAGNEWWVIGGWIDREDPHESDWLIDTHHEHLRRAITEAVRLMRNLTRLGVIEEH